MDVPAEPRWPPALAVMKTVDDLLRCGICFDYFNIAMMIPQCSHNYCSLCIRKFLSYKTQCPTCCVTVTEPDLKNNRVLDELVKSLNCARSRLLQLAFESPPTSPSSSFAKSPASRTHVPTVPRLSSKLASRSMDSFLIRENDDSASQPLGKEESRPSPQKQTGTSTKAGATPSMDKAAATGSSACSVPETPSTSALKHVTRVDCPVCTVSIPEHNINKHLDSCLTRDEKKESLRSSAHKRKPLPKTVYNLLSDRDLKKKLKQHGLSVQGSKQQLIKRHQEFVHMYNAQCDSLHPKSAAEIVQEIEAMEKTRMRLEASKINDRIMVFTKDQTEKEIDEIHSRYRKKHQSEFQLLVDQAKKRYKKTSGMSRGNGPKREDERTEKLPAVCLGKRSEAQKGHPTCPDEAETAPGAFAVDPPEEEDSKGKFSDAPLTVTLHHPPPEPPSPGLRAPVISEDSSSSADLQEQGPSSPESDSCNSSSSDILRDLLEEEEAWEAAHKNDLQNPDVSPRHSRRSRSADSAAAPEPRNKRYRN